MTIKDSHEFKHLHTRAEKLKNELNFVEAEQKELATKWKDVRKKLNNIEKEIKFFQNKEIVITEHALLRYLERVKKINLAEIKKEILTEEAINIIEKVGSATIPINDFEIVVKNRIVLTVNCSH